MPSSSADAPKTIRLVVKLEGGLIQWVGTDSELPIEVAIIDYDTEGADDDEIVGIPQESTWFGNTEDAVARVETAELKKEFVTNVFLAIENA